MSHYFLHDEELKSNEYNVRYSFNGVDFHLVSNNGVFSKTRIDEGTYILLHALLNLPIKGKVLDLGCGYGVAGITLKYFFKDIELTMSDVNETCISLTIDNLKKYNFDALTVISDGFNAIKDNFDFIVFNPPIRIGKDAIYKIYRDAYIHLNQNGHFLIVIRKDKGALSHIKFLKTIFKDVQEIKRDRGYFVYDIIK